LQKKQMLRNLQQKEYSGLTDLSLYPREASKSNSSLFGRIARGFQKRRMLEDRFMYLIFCQILRNLNFQFNAA
jgi:hypothetical protein